MTMTLRETLSAEHAELDQLAETLLTMVSEPGPPATFSATRWRLNHVLSVHLAKEDQHLYPTLQQSDNVGTRALAICDGDAEAALAEATATMQAKYSDEAYERQVSLVNEQQALNARLANLVQSNEDARAFSTEGN